MYKYYYTFHLHKGFTLIEVAVVLIILSLLLGGLISPLTAQIDQRNYTQTQQVLVEIKEALVGFSLSHDATNGEPYLPCPDTDGDGLENRTGSACTNFIGTIPTQNLGLQSTDAWNNQILYRVSPSFSDNANGFNLTSLGNIDVLNASAGTTLVSNVPVLVISTGKNSVPLAGNTDELENTDNDLSFVSHEFTPTYDDVVVWLSPNILFNRLVTAGKLP